MDYHVGLGSRGSWDRILVQPGYFTAIVNMLQVFVVVVVVVVIIIIIIIIKFYRKLP
jgi:hypothetical protein